MHFERVGFNAKTIDCVVIFKEGAREKGQDEYVRISAIPANRLDAIKDWLLEIVQKV